MSRAWTGTKYSHVSIVDTRHFLRINASYKVGTEGRWEKGFHFNDTEKAGEYKAIEKLDGFWYSFVNFP